MERFVPLNDTHAFATFVALTSPFTSSFEDDAADVPIPTFPLELLMVIRSPTPPWWTANFPSLAAERNQATPHVTSWIRTRVAVSPPEWFSPTNEAIGPTEAVLVTPRASHEGAPIPTFVPETLMAVASWLTWETMSFQADELSAVFVVAFGRDPQVAAANAVVASAATRANAAQRPNWIPLKKGF